MDLLSTKQDANGKWVLSVSVQTTKYPVFLTVFSELRDKHGVHPSIEHVLQKGEVFSIFSSDPADLHVASVRLLNDRFNRQSKETS